MSALTRSRSKEIKELKNEIKELKNELLRVNTTIADTFRCIVCQEVPTDSGIVQCTNGHLTCGECFQSLRCRWVFQMHFCSALTRTFLLHPSALKKKQYMSNSGSAEIAIHTFKIRAICAAASAPSAVKRCKFARWLVHGLLFVRAPWSISYRR